LHNVKSIYTTGSCRWDLVHSISFFYMHA